jgi:amino acid transporter
MTPEAIDTPQPGTPSWVDQQLVRAIGPKGLAANAVNSAMGGGIFVLPGLVAAMLGPSAIFAYFICGLAVALVLTCFIEIGSFVQRSGGAVAYVEEAFGPMMGFLAWLLYSVGFSILSCAALGAILVDTGASILPAMAHGGPRVLALLLLFGGLAAVNVVGVRQGVRFLAGTTIAKLLPLLFILAAGMIVMHWQNLRWAGWPPYAKMGEASLLLFFAFQGAEDALTTSGEIRDPARTVPRAMFGAIGALVFLFAALHIVSQGVLGNELALQSAAPLAAVAGHVIGTAGRTLLLAGFAISIFSTLGGGLLTTPRAFFMVAQDGMLPAALGKVHPRFRTPHIAILTVASIEFLLAASGEFKRLAVLSSASILCVYLAICMAALRLRYTRTREPGAFRAPGGPMVGILGAITVIWLLSHSTRVEVGALAGTLALGIVYFFTRRLMLSRSRSDTSCAAPQI